MPELLTPLFQLSTTKGFALACSALELAVAEHEFGILAVHDLGQTLRSKGIDFEEQCRVFEVCHPEQAARVLKANMALAMALPCRISVFTDAGCTWIGMIRPEVMLRTLSGDPELAVVARDVEVSLVEIIEAAVA
jgi:uncharacterized protein (DUF302 family)